MIGKQEYVSDFEDYNSEDEVRETLSHARVRHQQAQARSRREELETPGTANTNRDILAMLSCMEAHLDHPLSTTDGDEDIGMGMQDEVVPGCR